MKELGIEVVAIAKIKKIVEIIEILQILFYRFFSLHGNFTIFIQYFEQI